MEITTIDNLSLLLIIIINIGAITRLVFCSMNMISGDPQEQHIMKRRMRNIIIFAIIANTIFSIRSVFENYYK